MDKSPLHARVLPSVFLQQDIHVTASDISVQGKGQLMATPWWNPALNPHFHLLRHLTGTSSSLGVPLWTPGPPFLSVALEHG